MTTFLIHIAIQHAIILISAGLFTFHYIVKKKFSWPLLLMALLLVIGGGTLLVFDLYAAMPEPKAEMPLSWLCSDLVEK